MAKYRSKEIIEAFMPKGAYEEIPTYEYVLIDAEGRVFKLPEEEFLAKYEEVCDAEA